MAPAPDRYKDRLFHSRMIRQPGWGGDLPETKPVSPRMIRPVVCGGGPACRQTGVSQRVHGGFLRSRPASTPHRISLRLAARLLRLPPKGGVIALGTRASRPHPVPLVAAELECDAAGSHPVGRNRIGHAEGGAWRRSRLIQVGEMGEAGPGFVRAGRPRSQEAIIP